MSGEQRQPRGAEDDRWDVLAEEEIRIARLRPLVETLDDEFDSEAGGYRQLHTITDDYRRAVVSDLIGRSAQGMVDNLLDARLAQRAFSQLYGSDGVRLPDRETGREAIRRGAWGDIHLGTFVGSLESAFDCLAAVAIGVLRIPKPLKRAQLSQFKDLSMLKAPTKKLERAWDDWGTLLDFHRTSSPPGWSEWLNGMRNLHLHRARQNRILLQRTRDDDQPQVILMTENPEALTRETARFDLHLRARPRLTDMEDYVLAPTSSDLWLRETADVTLAGVFDGANEMIEDASHFLLAWWRYAKKWSSTSFPPPSGRAWAPETQLGPSYGGSAPSAEPFKPSVGLGYPTLSQRLAVAERLRQSGTLPGAARNP